MHEYDSRWYIIHDRYDYPTGPGRTLEVRYPHLLSFSFKLTHVQDLKDRYCNIGRKLTRNRPGASDEATKQQIAQAFTFDKGTSFLSCTMQPRPTSHLSVEKETTRKKYIASLLSRTPEEIAEEEALYLEIKRLEQTERRFRRERDDLLRTLLGVDSGLPELAQEDDGAGASASNANGPPDGKKRKRATEVDSPITPSVVPALGRRSGSACSAEYGERLCPLLN
jgi:DNA methyltransferase 1-associated protein 1